MCLHLSLRLVKAVCETISKGAAHKPHSVVGRWGGNLAIQVPVCVARASGLADGVTVEIECTTAIWSSGGGRPMSGPARMLRPPAGRDHRRQPPPLARRHLHPGITGRRPAWMTVGVVNEMQIPCSRLRRLRPSCAGNGRHCRYTPTRGARCGLPHSGSHRSARNRLSTKAAVRRP